MKKLLHHSFALELGRSFSQSPRKCISLNFMSYGIKLFILLALFFISACTTSPKNSNQIEKEKLTSIHNINVFIVHPLSVLSYKQDLSSRHTTAAGFGLTGALISGLISTAQHVNLNYAWEKNAPEFIAAVKDYDYEVEFEQKLKSMLERKGLQVTTHRLYESNSTLPLDMELLFAEKNSDASVVITYRYSVSAGFLMYADGSLELFFQKGSNNGIQEFPSLTRSLGGATGAFKPSAESIEIVLADRIKDDGLKIRNGLEHLRNVLAMQVITSITR